MRIALAMLLVAAWLVVPWMATAGHDHHHSRGTHMSNHSGFEIEGDLLVITNHDRQGKEKVIICEDGLLTIDGQKIKTDDKSRKLLKKFYCESVKLEEQASLIAEDAQELAEDATVFAASSILKALRSLGDAEDDETAADFAELEADFEEQAESIEKLGDEIEQQADKLQDMAEELRDRIPELDELEWFLDS